MIGDKGPCLFVFVFSILDLIHCLCRKVVQRLVPQVCFVAQRALGAMDFGHSFGEDSDTNWPVRRMCSWWPSWQEQINYLQRLWENTPRKCISQIIKNTLNKLIQCIGKAKRLFLCLGYFCVLHVWGVIWGGVKGPCWIFNSWSNDVKFKPSPVEVHIWDSKITTLHCRHKTDTNKWPRKQLEDTVYAAVTAKALWQTAICWIQYMWQYPAHSSYISLTIGINWMNPGNKCVGVEKYK